MSDSKNIHEIIAGIRQGFIDELPEKINTLENLTMNHAQDDNIQELYRNIHSLKGTGGTLDLPIITSICHQFESFLNKYIDGVEEHNNFIGIALLYVDLLKDTSQLLIDDIGSFSEIEKKLESIRSETESNSISILISGLSPVELSILKESLPEQSSYRSVSTGLAALEALTLEEYDYFITSQETPSLTGLATIAAIKHNNSLNKDIKTILLTSNRIDSKQKSLANAIIKKDVNMYNNLKLFIESS